MAYGRPPGAAQADFLGARAYEELVGEWLGDFKIARLDSTTELDYWVPGFYADVKQKKQPLGKRWHLLPDVPEHDLFVLDELSVRKAAEKGPHAYFIINDVPLDRHFLARIDEVFTADRVRVNRVYDSGRAKGKWIIDLSNFRQLTDPASEILPAVLADQIQLPWRASPCLSLKEVAEV